MAVQLPWLPISVVFLLLFWVVLWSGMEPRALIPSHYTARELPYQCVLREAGQLWQINNTISKQREKEYGRTFWTMWTKLRIFSIAAATRSTPISSALQYINFQFLSKLQKVSCILRTKNWIRLWKLGWMINQTLYLD